MRGRRARERVLAEREAALAARETELLAREAALADRLRDVGARDSLTGLASLDRLRGFLDTGFDGAGGGVLLLLDIERFHDVNEMLGHDAGDQILVEVAERLAGAPAPGSLIARVAADQFAVAVPGAVGSEIGRLNAMAVKGRVEGSIRFADLNADVRVAMGIARSPDHGSGAADLLRRAELAMTTAAGTASGIAEWEPGDERDGARRLQVLTGLREALGDGSLRLAYQPKVSLTTGEVAGFEALVRWTHPTLGELAPDEFVPLAEATGLISTLTTTVLRRALVACRSWHDAGKPVGVAVNLSARSLDSPALVGQVGALLAASNLEPRWLTLEITESSVLAHRTRSVEVLGQFRNLGVRLAIDDFGTGYSSLHQLRGLPVQEVKIDQTFVTSVHELPQDRAVVHAIVELCRSLGLETVAEGVELVEQADQLRSLGVADGQGFYFARPLDPEEALAWLVGQPVRSLATY
ncbi:MAG TPA: bifunctional diguanylate cyclase/phosphodiesterase [Mycobacteriales bacterium]|nr:bifunctional diguanylate cyclase/phosphodiesterase [Mycobacteriales bacterium]